MRISDWSSDVCSSDLDVGLLAKPADLQRLQLALAVDHPHVDLQTVLVGQKLLHPIVDLQVRADQDQSILRILDEFFKEIVGRTCIEELGHIIPSASLALVSRRIVARTRARPRHAKFGSPRKKSQKWWKGKLGRKEEHTSELQSLMRISYAVFCEKKK